MAANAIRPFLASWFVWAKMLVSRASSKVRKPDNIMQFERTWDYVRVKGEPRRLPKVVVSYSLLLDRKVEVKKKILGNDDVKNRSAR